MHLLGVGSMLYRSRAMTGPAAIPANPPLEVRLREAQPLDVATLFAFESDPAWRTMAMVKPRTREAFEAIWEKVFQDQAASAGAPRETSPQHRVILANIGRGWEVCGAIGCRRTDEGWSVGYGLGAAYWGRGIASRALALLLADVKRRPLLARAAASNAASIRVLEKNGFVIECTQPSPETERYLACDEVRMMLR